MKKPRLTEPQLYWLRKAVYLGSIWICPGPGTRVANKLLDLGLIESIKSEDSTFAPTRYGQEVAERGGIL